MLAVKDGIVFSGEANRSRETERVKIPTGSLAIAQARNVGLTIRSICDLQHFRNFLPLPQTHGLAFSV